MKKCPECESDKIIKDALALDRGDYNANIGFQVAVDENPQAFMFKQRTTSTTYIKICGNCGFIQFYAANPHILWLAYQNRLSKS